MSASATRQIAVFERSHGLPAGEVVHAFRRWSTTAGRPLGDVDPFYEIGDAALRRDDYHVRTLLEGTLHSLRGKARRELSTVIDPADERMLRRTLNNPFADPDLPWWMHRIGI